VRSLPWAWGIILLPIDRFAHDYHEYLIRLDKTCQDDKKRVQVAARKRLHWMQQQAR
jgi:hypothetical protein